MLMRGRIIPTIGESLTPPSFDGALELSCHLWVCLLAYRLGIKVYLNLTCRLGHNWFQSVYVMPLCYVILSKVVPCPLPSCFRARPSWPTHLKSFCRCLTAEGKPLPTTLRSRVWGQVHCFSFWRTSNTRASILIMQVEVKPYTTLLFCYLDNL